MKTKILVLTLCLLLLVSPVLAVGNIITNGDFETGVFSPWSTGGDYAATIVGSGRSGDCAQFYTATNDYSGYITRTLDESIGSGTMTYWFKVGTLGGSGSVWIDVYEDGTLRKSQEVSAYTGLGWYQITNTGFATTGSHTVQITVDYASGRNGVVWIDDVVMNSQVPTVSFTPTSSSGTVPLTVDFTGTAAHVRDSGAGDSYDWNFGDGSAHSNQLSPSHEYSSAGSYTVTFRGTNDFDYTETTGSVTTTTPVAAGFSASSTNIVTGASITFTDTSTGSPTSWAWDFTNDGTNESTSQNPSYTYTSAGTKSPKLYAWKTGASDVELKTSYITVSDDLVAAFVCTPNGGSIAQGTLVTCNPDTSSGTPTGWSWNFGEGAANTSRYASHTYSTPGTFTVVLTATKTYQSDAETKTDFFTVGNVPVVDFSGTPTSGVLPFTVVFTGTNSGGAASSWAWTFGDGDSTNSTVQSPVHRYSSGGPFTVAVTATNAYGSDTETKVGYVSIGTVPVASFSANRTLATLPNGNILFTDTSSGTPTSWDWGWGDGTANTTATATPVHNYTAAGTYTVGLRATNAFGTGWYSNPSYITILAAPVAGTGYTISGIVKNVETNATIGSAEITLSNITSGSSWTTTTYTSTAGTFYFVNLTNGTYVLSSGQSGYVSYTSANIVINGASPDAIPVLLTPSTTVPSSMRYYPHLTRFVLKDIYGNPIPGVTVAAQGYQITASHNWVLEMIGLDLSRTKLDTQSMSGITGSDGSVVFLMLEIVSYEISFSGGPIVGTPTETLFPKEDSYLYQLAITGAGTLFEQGSSVLNHTLTAETLSYTSLKFQGTFNDTTGHTSSGYFWITNATGSQVYNQTVASNNLSVNYTLTPFVPGSMYFFGLNMTNSDYGYISYMEVITAPAGRLLHPLEDRGIDVEWYKWITVIALILFVAMFSGITNIYGSLLFPIWSLFFTLIGWLDWCPTPFVIGVACLGGMVFLSKRNSQVGDG